MRVLHTVCLTRLAALLSSFGSSEWAGWHPPPWQAALGSCRLTGPDAWSSPCSRTRSLASEHRASEAERWASPGPAPPNTLPCSGDVFTGDCLTLTGASHPGGGLSEPQGIPGALPQNRCCRLQTRLLCTDGWQRLQVSWTQPCLGTVPGAQPCHQAPYQTVNGSSGVLGVCRIPQFNRLVAGIS